MSVTQPNQDHNERNSTQQEIGHPVDTGLSALAWTVPPRVACASCAMNQHREAGSFDKPDVCIRVSIHFIQKVGTKLVPDIQT